MDLGLAVGVGAAGLLGTLRGSFRERPKPPEHVSLPFTLQASMGARVLDAATLTLVVVATGFMALSPLVESGVPEIMAVIDVLILFGVIGTFRRRLEVTQAGVRIRLIQTGRFVTWQDIAKVRYVARSFVLHGSDGTRLRVPTELKGIENFVAALSQLGSGAIVSEAVKGYLASVNR